MNNPGSGSQGMWKRGHHLVSFALALGPILALGLTLIDWRPPFGNVLAVSPDGKLLATAYRSNRTLWTARPSTLELLSLSTGERLLSKRTAHEITALAFSLDSTQLAVGHKNGLVELWHTESLEVVTEHQPGNAPVRLLAYRKHAEALIVSSPSITWFIEPSTGRKFSSVNATVRALSKDGERAIAAKRTPTVERGMLALYEIRSNKLNKVADLQLRDGVVSLSPNGKQLAVSNYTSLRVWDLERTTRVSRTRAPVGVLGMTEFSSDGRFVISHGLANALLVWSIGNGVKTKFVPTQTAISDVVLGPDDDYLVASGLNGAVFVIDFADGNLGSSFRQEFYSSEADWVAIGTVVVIAVFSLWSLAWIGSGHKHDAPAGRPMLDVVLVAGIPLAAMALRTTLLQPTTITRVTMCSALSAIVGSGLAWVFLGRHRWYSQLPAVLVSLALVWGIARVIEPLGPSVSIAATGAIIALTLWLTTLIALRLAQIRIRRRAGPESQLLQMSGSQFSLRHPFVWLAAAGILLGVAREIRPRDLPNPSLIELTIMCELAVITVMTASLAALATQPWIKIPIAFGVAAVCGWLPQLLPLTLLRVQFRSAIQKDWFVLMLAISATVVSATLLFRLHGYRLHIARGRQFFRLWKIGK